MRSVGLDTFFENFYTIYGRRHLILTLHSRPKFGGRLTAETAKSARETVNMKSKNFQEDS